MSKLFSCDHDQYDMVKCHRNVSLEEMDTEPWTEKSDGFWLLQEIFKEYIRQNIIMAMSRKSNAHSIVICRLIKKSIM